jgi:hypothetical protein
VKRLAALAFALLCPAFSWAGYNSYTEFASGTAPSYEGLWWNPSESGWGVSIAHQGDILFAVWYTYDSDGSPMWLVMPDARLTSDEDMSMGMMGMEMMGMTRNPPIYSGMLYRSRLAANKVVMTEVGMATFLFKSRTSGVFAYTVGNVSQAKNISLMAFASGTHECALGGAKAAGAPENYQDLWWNPFDSGWGVNIAHQADTLFATYYTYDANGKGEWYVMPNTVKYDAGAQFTGYTGPMVRATGPAFDSPSWDASKVKLSDLGSVSFVFGNGEGAMHMPRDVSAQVTKPLKRMAFSVPATVCH